MPIANGRAAVLRSKEMIGLFADWFLDWF